MLKECESAIQAGRAVSNMAAYISLGVALARGTISFVPERAKN